MTRFAPLLLTLALLPSAAPADPLERAIEVGRDTQQQLREAQSEVESLDDQTLALATEYADTLRRLERQRDYLRRLRATADAQDEQVRSLRRQLAGLDDTRERLGPLLARMQATFGKLVAADLPFALDERRARDQRMAALVDDLGSDNAEKLRRLLEAYQVEIDYGYRLEVETGPLPGSANGAAREVDLVRLGRVALYYLSLDRREAGAWSRGEQRWQVLPNSAIPPLERAVRIARKQQAPALLVLPLPAPQTKP